jgi:hypothetical protein
MFFRCVLSWLKAISPPNLLSAAGYIQDRLADAQTNRLVLCIKFVDFIQYPKYGGDTVVLRRWKKTQRLNLNITS